MLNKKEFKNLYNFYALHKRFVQRFICADILLSVVALIYMLLPLNVLALSLGNLVFLFLFIFAVVLFQIQLYRTSCGKASFYLMLPLNRLLWINLVSVLLIIPFTILVLMEFFIISITRLMISDIHLFGNIVDKVFHVIIINVLIKSIALPVFMLYKKHILLVPLFFILLSILYLISSMIHECFFRNNEKPELIIITLFTCLVYYLCYRLLKSSCVE